MKRLTIRLNDQGIRLSPPTANPTEASFSFGRRPSSTQSGQNGQVLKAINHRFISRAPLNNTFSTFLEKNENQALSQGPGLDKLERRVVFRP